MLPLDIFAPDIISASLRLQHHSNATEFLAFSFKIKIEHM